MTDHAAAPQGISVRYIYSACVVIATPDIRILSDPWFTEGVYDGSWFQFPKVDKPIELIGDVDVIYVSHLHPDHYDAKFLRQYFAAYGKKEVVIAAHTPNHLANKMRVDGFGATILQEPRQVGKTRFEILPHKTGSSSDIDSALIVKYTDAQRTHCVVNSNDIIFDDAMSSELKGAAGEVDILLCGYTGAGPYPQTYFDFSDAALAVQAQKKKEAFFERYRALVKTMEAKVNVPFAGQYILGGKLVQLNDYRGVADAVEVLPLDPHAVVLADAGGEIDTGTLRTEAVRTKPHSVQALRQREAEISALPMDYERLIPLEEVHQLPIKRLLATAARKASERSECDHDYYFAIRISDDESALINACKSPEKLIQFVRNDATLPTPRSEIDIDVRYLFGLLTNVYHWNNAEVGSQYNTRRFPNELDRQAQNFLNYLAVA